MQEARYTLRVRTEGFTGKELAELEGIIESISGSGTVQPRTGEPLPDGALFAPAPSIHITVHLSSTLQDAPGGASQKDLVASYRKIAEQVSAKTSHWISSRFAGGRREVATDMQLFDPDMKLVKGKIG